MKNQLEKLVDRIIERQLFGDLPIRVTRGDRALAKIDRDRARVRQMKHLLRKAKKGNRSQDDN